MRVLLDECVPRALRKELLGHDVKKVAEVGWAGVKTLIDAYQAEHYPIDFIG
jgi:hypothetical protein